MSKRSTKTEALGDELFKLLEVKLGRWNET